MPVEWVGGMEALPHVCGYDMLQVVLRLVSLGVLDADPQLVLDGRPVPDRADREALRAFHGTCSRFYVSIGAGGGEFWRRSRGTEMLDRKLLSEGETPAALLDRDVVVTFGRRERGGRRRRGVARELLVCNFALRLAAVPHVFLQKTLKDPETGKPLVISLRHGKPPESGPKWETLAADLADNPDLIKALLETRVNVRAFLEDPARSDFEMGPHCESVSLGLLHAENTLTRHGLGAGWTRQLDLTPYLPTGAGGPVYVRVETSPFVFHVAWEQS